MDEFRRGLLMQMGENRSRTRRAREPWIFGAVGTAGAGAIAWFLGLILVPAGLFVGSWGYTMFRNSRIKGSERDRLLGQFLVLVGSVVSLVGAWRFSRG